MTGNLAFNQMLAENITSSKIADPDDLCSLLKCGSGHKGQGML